MADDHHSAAVLLATEHAVARVLAEACDEASAYPRLLTAIGGSLGWDAGAVWAGDGEALRCIASWPEGSPFARETSGMVMRPGDGLPGRVWVSGEPAWIVDVGADANFPRAPSAVKAGLHAAFCIPIHGTSGAIAAIEFLAARRRDPDAHLLETMTSLGGRIGQCIDRWRAEDRLRDSEARKTAILNAAFDCIITMDAQGNVVEVNQATERTFGYTASEMVGRELAELIIPPELREPHRRGVERYVATGEAHIVGHPVELPAMRKDGSEFPVEIAIARPQIPGPPLFTGYLRDVTERKRDELALRSLAAEQAALRRVATTVASEADEARVISVVTAEVARLLGARSREPDPLRDRRLRGRPRRLERRRRAERAGGNARRARCRDGGGTDPAQRPPGASRRLRHGHGTRRRARARARVHGVRRRADPARRSPVGRGRGLDRAGDAVPAGRRAADRRLRGAGRAGARQRRGAPRARGLARPDRRGRRRRAAAARAQPARRRAAAPGGDRAQPADVRAQGRRG